MNELFGLEKNHQENHNFMDEVLHPEEILFVVFILTEKLNRITLTHFQTSASFEHLTFGTFNDELFVNGERVEAGQTEIEGIPLFVLPAGQLHTHFLLLDHLDLIINDRDENRAIETKDNSYIVINNHDSYAPKCAVKPDGPFVYFNEEKLIVPSGFDFNVGDQLLTSDLMIERRKHQWKVTTFSNDVIFNPESFLEQARISEKPQDFPEYRRSPRLNLELPEKAIKYEKIPDREQAPKGGIVKMIAPPLGMLVAGGLTTMLSGRNPLMMLATALASLMAVIFTVTQYVTEKKDRFERESHRESDYQNYLAKTTSRLGQAHRKEKQVLHYQHPSPEDLLEKIESYDSRLYERLANNKDFMQVSLGTGTQPSSLKVSSDYMMRDEDEWANHVKNLVTHYSQQENVPLPLDLRKQTLGLVGTYDVLRESVCNLYLQLAFFHSYRDVNLISLVPEKAYQEDWDKWRFLPHFVVQGINTRGIVHNAKSRDVVLSSFYQLINSRKQELNRAGREKPTFLPHFVLTIFDDSYLAGHGLNEFLAEDMSDLGVTVIWCKEDKKLLPETVSALVEMKNGQAGVLVQDNGHHMDKVFKPYPPLETKENFEIILRQLTSLEHMEVEKNAIPEHLS
ncbi:MAG: hypothetical protein FWF42_03015, partial [Streptococcaceae bacterium]|nr:hypothetical protein [Streptococcaceae bacterium]